MDCSPPDSSVHEILQGIFSTQQSNLHPLCLLYWQVGSGKLSVGVFIQSAEDLNRTKRMSHSVSFCRLLSWDTVGFWTQTETLAFLDSWAHLLFFKTFSFMLGYSQLQCCDSSGEQWRDSAVHTPVSILPQTSIQAATRHCSSPGFWIRICTFSSPGSQTSGSGHLYWNDTSAFLVFQLAAYRSWDFSTFVTTWTNSL